MSCTVHSLGVALSSHPDLGAQFAFPGFWVDLGVARVVCWHPPFSPSCPNTCCSQSSQTEGFEVSSVARNLMDFTLMCIKKICFYNPVDSIFMKLFIFNCHLRICLLTVRRDGLERQRVGDTERERKASISCLLCVPMWKQNWLLVLLWETTQPSNPPGQAK